MKIDDYRVCGGNVFNGEFERKVQVDVDVVKEVNMFLDLEFVKVFFLVVVVYRKDLIMCFRINEIDRVFLIKK